MVFFAGLWWTAKRLPVSKRPAALAVASLIIRMCAMVGVLLLLSRFGRWEPLAAALVGFVMVRVAAVRLTKKRNGRNDPTWAA